MLRMPVLGSYMNPLTFLRTYFTLPVPKQLGEVVKLSLFKRESAETLQYLWIDQFKNRSDVAVDVLAQSEWKLVKQK